MRTTGRPKRMVGYCRVSTGQQARSGLGLDDQQAKITDAARREGWEIVAWKVDRGETGKSLDRPEFLSALQMVADGDADGLVASKLDRVARSVHDFTGLVLWFSDGGKHLAILSPEIDTTTATGRFVANLFASFAELEAAMISERTSDALARRRAAGLPITRSGVVDSPDLAARVRDMHGAGLSLHAIARTLNAEGIPTVSGGSEWRASSIQSVLGYKRPTKRRTPDLPTIKRQTKNRRKTS